MTDVEPIKRYEIATFTTHTRDSWFEEYESEDGDYVKYEDHKRELDAEKARAAAACGLARKAIRHIPRSSGAYPECCRRLRILEESAAPTLPPSEAPNPNGQVRA